MAGAPAAVRDGDAIYRAFLAAVILAGSFVLAWSLMTLSAQPIALEWLMLVVLTAVSGWATLRLRAIPASFSISDTFTIAAALLFGPAAGAVTVAVMSALANIIWALSGMLGPTVGGAFAEWAGDKVAFGVLALVSAVVVPVLLRYARAERRAATR